MRTSVLGSWQDLHFLNAGFDVYRHVSICHTYLHIPCWWSNTHSNVNLLNAYAYTPNILFEHSDERRTCWLWETILSEDENNIWEYFSGPFKLLFNKRGSLFWQESCFQLVFCSPHMNNPLLILITLRVRKLRTFITRPKMI